MSSISVHQKRLLFLLLFLLHTLLYAEKIAPLGVTDLKISFGINDYKSKAIDVVTKVKDDKKIIFASGWIENAPKDTTVTFKCYREIGNNKVDVLVESTIKVTGSRFIYSRIMLENGLTARVGRYGVDVKVGDRVLATTSFEIVSSRPPSAKNSCTTFDNVAVKRDINRLLDKYPQMKSDTSLNFGLYSDPKNGIIFYLPNGWFSIVDSSDTIVYLSQEKKNIINKYMVRKVKRFWDEDDIKNPEEFVYYSAKAMGNISIELATKSGDSAEYAGEISIFHFKSYTIAHQVIHRKGKMDRYKSSTFIWNGSDLYTLAVTTKENDLQLGEFLSSLWYMTFCDDKSTIIDPKDIPSSKCLKPDIDSDNELINTLFDENKDMKKVAIDNSLRFKRYLNTQKGFSIIAPDGWEVVPRSKNIIFDIRHLDENGIYQEMSIYKISVNDEMMKSNAPKQVLENFAKHMSTPKDGEVVELVKKLKVIDLKDRVVGRFGTKETVGGVESFQFYTMVLKDNRLNLISAIVDKTNYDLGRLISTIGLYTFVTREICGG